MLCVITCYVKKNAKKVMTPMLFHMMICVTYLDGTDNEGQNRLFWEKINAALPEIEQVKKQKEKCQEKRKRMKMKKPNRDLLRSTLEV